MTKKEKMEILAGAIRSEARRKNYDPRTLSNDTINAIGDEYYRQNPDTIAAQFYGDEDDCTERNWREVCRMVRR